MALTYTDVAQIEPAYDELKTTFSSGKTKSLAWRKQQLKQLGLMIQDNEPAWLDAVYNDLSRPRGETVIGETNLMKSSVNDAIANLDKWTKPTKVSGGLAWMAASPQVIPCPKGTVLVLGAWNFPISLTLDPVVGAIAAGNTVLMKPSELAPHAAALIAELVPKYLDPAAVKVVNGDAAQATALLSHRWDHIFYTGSGTVGRVVAKAAAEHLTPVTLELGGKSPAVVFDDADLMPTARRILWGKYTNAGQICIASDYVICTEQMQAKLIEAFKKIVDEYNPTDKDGSKISAVDSDEYTAMVNERHYSRVNKLIEATKGRLVIDGGRNDEKRKIGITVVADVKPDDELMKGELFGPVLPIVVVADEQGMVDQINVGDIPLALYVFTNSKKNSDFIFNNTRSGTFVHGDSVVQFTLASLPFGGAGQSGMGSYHGKHSFDAFSHMRSHMSVPNWMELVLAARYPPYTKAKLKQVMMFTGATVKGESEHWASTSRVLSALIALAAVSLGVSRLTGQLKA